MNTDSRCALILAAGDGTRMKSSRSKVLCEVALKPMISWVVSSCEKAGIKNIAAVLGSGADEVKSVLPEGVNTFLQTKRLGTGHAVSTAAEFLKEHSEKDVVILCGDAPFVDEDALSASYEYHKAARNAVTVITAELDDPSGYGRIIRSGDGISAIVEQKDASPEQLAVKEVNSGAYWFSVKSLTEVLSLLKTDNAQGEYYLTDTIALLLDKGERAGAFKAENSDIVLGANDRAGLLRLNEAAKRRILNYHMQNGVEIVSADGVVISPDVKIGADTKILPGTILCGKTIIGSGCTMGPQFAYKRHDGRRRRYIKRCPKLSERYTRKC